ncbi:YpzI family protein [Bacillus sp. FJAT-50079]|nr:YpzI family protein [Bacillus sp. FJAT-50079]
MGRDRQEKKLKNMRKVESDRDQALHYGGATRYEKPGEKGKSINES